MIYKKMTESDVAGVAKAYVEYYNQHENGCWTFEKAYKRIHQILTIEDSLCLLQYDEAGSLTGFAIGYYKEYDDLKAYYLEEIVILKQFQNRGCGSALLHELERTARDSGATHLELLSVSDDHHLHFYKKAGFYAATTLCIMGKDLS